MGAQMIGYLTSNCCVKSVFMESIDIYALFLSDKTKIAQQNRCLNILRDGFKQTLHAPTLLF